MNSIAVEFWTLALMQLVAVSRAIRICVSVASINSAIREPGIVTVLNDRDSDNQECSRAAPSPSDLGALAGSQRGFCAKCRYFERNRKRRRSRSRDCHGSSAAGMDVCASPGGIEGAPKCWRDGDKVVERVQRFRSQRKVKPGKVKE